MLSIRERVQAILKELPSGVSLVVASKGRHPEEIIEAIKAGAKIIGENYLQEAERKKEKIPFKVKWHFIGNLQKNKAKKIIELFDVIESLSSLELAEVLNNQARKQNKLMPVFLEVNSAGEEQKKGFLPQEVEEAAEYVFNKSNLRLEGLMTMGPFLNDIESIRPFFRKTRELFFKIKQRYAREYFQYLSMGMSDTYKIGIEEGANIVRIGRKIFSS